MYEAVIEGIRWTNAVAASAGLLWLGIRSFRRWSEYPYTIRLFLLTLSYYVFGVAYGSAEAAVLNAAVGVRSLVALTANVALLVTLALTQKRRPLEVRRG